jgi:DNA-directed RNA polymerase specialized sigma24 family protein
MPQSDGIDVAFPVIVCAIISEGFEMKLSGVRVARGFAANEALEERRSLDLIPAPQFMILPSGTGKEEQSDGFFLRSVAEGSKAAMHILFARHRARVFCFVERIVGNSRIADDLVSLVFLDVWRSANRLEKDARVSVWLLSIARFKAVSSAEVAGAVLYRKKTQGILRICMDKLSPVHREIIDAYYYRGKSIAEMSEIFGIPQATSKSRVFYARKQFARILVSAGSEAVAVATNVKREKAATPFSRTASKHASARGALPRTHMNLIIVQEEWRS